MNKEGMDQLTKFRIMDEIVVAVQNKLLAEDTAKIYVQRYLEAQLKLFESLSGFMGDLGKALASLKDA